MSPLYFYLTQRGIVNTLNILTVALLVTQCGTIQTCSKEHGIKEEGENIMPQQSIEQVLKDHADELMAIAGVVGVGQSLCAGKDCLHVYVVKNSEELARKIPSEIEGYHVEIITTGEIKALPDN